MPPVKKNGFNESTTPEITFLLACLRQLPWTEEEKANISNLLKNEIDWEYVIRSAGYHKCIPLLHRAIVDNFKTLIPEGVLKKITAIQKIIVFRGLAQSASLANIISLLDQNGIDVLPIKGPLLAQRLYGSITMRTYGDIDILVRKQDIKRSLDILIKNNYVLLPKGIPRPMYDRFMKHAYHGQLLDPRGTIIELHWELTGFYVTKGILFETLEPFLMRTEYFGHPSLDLTDEMLFIYLCIHGIKHQYEKLDYLCSIAELLKNAPDINWRLIFNLCNKFKITRGLLLSLALVDKLFGLPVSCTRDGLAASEQNFKEFADKLIKWNLTMDSTRDITNPLHKNDLYNSFVFDTRLELARLFFHSRIIPHHEEWEKIKIPEALFYLYFFNKTYRVCSLSTANRLNILYCKITNSIQTLLPKKTG